MPFYFKGRANWEKWQFWAKARVGIGPFGGFSHLQLGQHTNLGGEQERRA
jgi:hypothetical protein